jgi:RNA polymerase sigma-70 factor (ECF subfamily)
MHIQGVGSKAAGMSDADAERLLAEASWVRRLALQLVRDASTAEDIVQETWLAALRHPPPSDGRLRPWLARVVLNLTRQHRRGELSRWKRETAAAKPDVAPSDRDSAQRLESQQLLLDALREVPEPFRSTLLGKYIDRLSAAELARREGIPASTVRWRLQRGIEELRRRLDKQFHGERRSWCLVLLPLLRRPPLGETAAASLSSAAKGALVMTTSTKAGIGAAIVLIAMAGAWIVNERQSVARAEPKSLVPELTLQAPPDKTADETLAPAGGDRVREGIGAPSTNTTDTRRSTAKAGPHERRMIEGSTLDLLADAVPDIPVEFFPDEPRDSHAEVRITNDAQGRAWFETADTGAVPHTPVESYPDEPRDSHADARTTSDAQGRFRLEITDRPGVLRVGPGPWTSVFQPRIEPSRPSSGYLLVVAAVQAHSGRVVDESGAPVSKAQVRIELPGSSSWIPRKGRSFLPDNKLRSSFPLRLDLSDTARWIVSSDTQGRFSIPNGPHIRDALLVTLHSGYATDIRSLPAGDGEIRITLRPAPSHLRGLVVDAHDAPAPRTWVFFGSNRTRTEEDGRFDLDLGENPEGNQLVAVKEGWMPVTQPCLAASPLDPRAWPDPLVLVLKQEALILRGQVVDAQGNPLPRCRVRALDPVGLDEILPHGVAKPVSEDVGKDLVLGGSEVSTDTDGQFALKGLVARRYRLHALDLGSIASVDTEPIEAGRTDVRIRIDTGACYPCVAGQLVDPTGRPVANMRVQARRTTAEGTLMSDEVRTDADGHFKLPPVSRDAESIVVLPESAVPRLFQIKGVPDLCSLHLVIPRFGDLRVEVVTPGLVADNFAVLTESGARIDIAKHYGGGGWEGPFEVIPVEDGKSAWAIVPEDAVTIILLKDGNEIARQSLQVKPEELSVVRM